jgi:hypothetical protein
MKVSVWMNLRIVECGELHFFPLVMETYGFMGKEFRTLLKRLNLLSSATIIRRNFPLSKQPSICLVFFSWEMLKSCSRVSIESTGKQHIHNDKLLISMSSLLQLNSPCEKKLENEHLRSRY